MVTIVKAGSFCPACMGTVLADCRHSTEDFRRALSPQAAHQSAAEQPRTFEATCLCGHTLTMTERPAEQIKPLVEALNELECDMPYLFGRAAKEGHQSSQILAKEVKAKIRQALATSEQQEKKMANKPCRYCGKQCTKRDTYLWGVTQGYAHFDCWMAENPPPPPKVWIDEAATIEQGGK